MCRLQLLEQCSVLLHSVPYLLDALEVHHFQRCQGRICIGGIEESQLVALFCRLVLGQLAECGLLGGRNGDIKYRLTASQHHTADHLRRCGPQLLPAELHKGILSGFPGDTEHPLFIVELPHQLDHEIALFGKGAICAFQHIAGELAAGFLHGCNGGSGCHAAGRAALADVPVAGGLLHLFDPAVPVAHAVPRHSLHHQLLEVCFVQPVRAMHHILAEVCELFLIDARRIAHDEASL